MLGAPAIWPEWPPLKGLVKRHLLRVAIFLGLQSGENKKTAIYKFLSFINNKILFPKLFVNCKAII